MTICYFGIYNPDYARSRVLINGLKQNGINVIECNSRRYGLLKYFDLFRKHWQIRGKYDFLLVGFPGYQAMVLARALARQPIIFDAFSSLYDSMVFDRRIVGPKSVRAKYYWFLDWFSCRLADRIIIDTNAHIGYYMDKFGIKKEKFIRVFVGADERIMRPVIAESNKDYFLVHFHGSCVPLQGIEYILAAAKILESENIKFKIIGSKIKKNFKDESLLNVDFLDDAPYGKLPQQMAMADICLGIFGNTNKARRVIPNKVFEALAVGRAILTGNSPAIRELLVDRENALFCRLADSQDLADKIMELKNNSELRENIAQKGRELFNQELTSRKIIENLLKEFKI